MNHMRLIERIFPGYVQNWHLLRTAVDEVGAECEKWRYDVLDRPAEMQPTLVRLINGREVTFSIDCWEKRPNGDLIISIDANGLSTLAGVKPTYQFAKRTDGTVYYP
jgi:hypothetical protein